MSSVLARPNLVARAALAMILAVAVVAIVVIASGGRSFDLNLRMANAGGLRPGSQVLLGGVPVGTVDTLDLEHNEVIARLHLDPAKVTIGRGVHASIIAANLLGEEYVALSPGDPHHGLESGTTLPASATTLPTDLDQIVDVLNGATRARLAILLDAAGTALAGRRTDLGALLRQIPLSLPDATNLLSTMVSDNHTLADTIANADSFIGHLDTQQANLTHLIDKSAGAATTFALRAAQLSSAVRGAPQSLSTLQRFAQDATARLDQLAPIATDLRQTAPSLTSLLTQVKPFTAVAVPALNRAAAVSPTLTALADQGTPTIRQGIPAVMAIEHTAMLAKPLSSWLGLSVGDLIRIANGWSRAIQYRDGLSHVFNGDFLLNPMIILSMADRGANAAQRRQNLLDVIGPSVIDTLHLAPAQAAARAALAGLTSVLPTPAASRSGAPKQTRTGSSSSTQGSAAGPTTGGQSGTTRGGVGATLGGLLGSLLGGRAGSNPSTGATGASGPGLGGALHGLLGYLMGK